MSDVYTSQYCFTCGSPYFVRADDSSRVYAYSAGEYWLVDYCASCQSSFKGNLTDREPLTNALIAEVKRITSADVLNGSMNPKITAIKYVRDFADRNGIYALQGLKASKEWVEAIMRGERPAAGWSQNAFATETVVETASSAETKTTIADELGLAASQIKVVTVRLDAFKNAGALVQVSVSGVSKLRRRSTDLERAILKIDPRAAIMTAGTTATLPKEARELDSIAVSVRSLLDRYSFGVKGFAPYRLVPTTAFKAWHTAHLALVARWERVLDLVIASLPAFTAEMEKTFREIGARAWVALAAQAEKDGAKTFEIGGTVYNVKNEKHAEAFVQRVIREAVSAIPSEATLRSAFKIEIEVAFAQLGSDFDAEMNRQDALREEKRYMRETLRDLLKEQVQSIADPFAEVIAELRERVAEDAEAVLETLSERDYLPGPSATRLRGIVEKVNMLSMGRDNALTLSAQQIDQIMSTKLADGSYDLESMRQVLESVIGLRETKAAQVDDLALSAVLTDDEPENSVRPSSAPSNEALNRAMAKADADMREPVNAGFDKDEMFDFEDARETLTSIGLSDVLDAMDEDDDDIIAF